MCRDQIWDHNDEWSIHLNLCLMNVLTQKNNNDHLTLISPNRFSYKKVGIYRVLEDNYTKKDKKTCGNL